MLRALAAHGDWQTGEDCYPHIKTLHRITGFSERTVQYTLRSLSCPSAASCGSTGRCHHRGLIRETEAATRYKPTVYAVAVELLVARQLHLPEITSRSGRTAPSESPPRRSDPNPLCLVCGEAKPNPWTSVCSSNCRDVLRERMGA